MKGAEVVLEQAERHLGRIVPALHEALEQQTTVLALSMWDPVSYVDLVPFHLHLKWPERLSKLALNARDRRRLLLPV